MFWNMDRALLRNGGRKAPKMTMEEFISLLKLGFPTEEEFKDDREFCEQRILYKICDADDDEIEPLLRKVLKDMAKVDVCTENVVFQDFLMGSNGVPCCWFLVGGDWEYPVFMMLYWDGKDFRCYIPTYGNTFDPKEKVAYGSAAMTNLGPHMYECDGELHTIQFRSSDEYLSFVESKFYCPTDEFDESLYFKENVDACLEDFSLRVVGSPATQEDLEKWKKTTKRRAQEDGSY